MVARARFQHRTTVAKYQMRGAQCAWRTWHWAMLCTASLLVAGNAQATPPTGSVVATTKPPAAQWVSHEVLSGERLAEIADRYAVSTASIVRWNKLDPAQPHYRAGQKLRVQTRLPARQREKVHYAVRTGDSWARIAERFHVSQRKLQHEWNHAEGQLQIGQEVLVWAEPTPESDYDGDQNATPLNVDDYDQGGDTAMPRIGLPGVAQSVGAPAHGHLVAGVQIPKNDALYSIRDPERAYGSSHAIEALVRGIASFRRETRFDREILIEDMSVQNGGRFGPHHSHRTGRDVDIALPFIAGKIAYTDWTATWRLMKSFVDTGEVRYIFLSRSRQVLLYKAAKQAGASSAELATILQYPRKDRTAIVRHARGHTQHMHVRFRCGPQESACEED